MVNNYIRHCKTSSLVFFATADGLPDLPIGDQSEWVIWWRPAGAEWEQFHLVGETTDDYCRHNAHAPERCKECRGETKTAPNGAAAGES